MRVRNTYLLIMVLAWGTCLTLGAASYAIVLRPQLEYRRELEGKVARAKQQYARALEAAKEKNRDDLAGQLDGMHQRIAEFVADPEAMSDLAFKIGELANAAGLQSFGMRPLARRGLDALPGLVHLGEKRVNVDFSARFSRFAAFLNALERHRPIVFVETFAINRPLACDGEPQVNMELAVLIKKPGGE